MITRPCKGRIDVRPRQGRGHFLVVRSVGVAHGYLISRLRRGNPVATAPGSDLVAHGYWISRLRRDDPAAVTIGVRPLLLQSREVGCVTISSLKSQNQWPDPGVASTDD
jgi:hypothetical protein